MVWENRVSLPPFPRILLLLLPLSIHHNSSEEKLSLYPQAIFLLVEKVISLEIEKEGTLWLLLGALLFLLDIIVVGVNRWEFPYGLVYAIGAILLTVVLGWGLQLIH